MRLLALVGWLLVPVLVAAWHYGPGQDYLRVDDAARLLGQAQEAAAAQDWATAAAKYEEALRLLPAERTAEARRIRLEHAKAQMLAKQLPSAHEELKNLVEELKDDPAADTKLLSEARSALASAQYYMTWLMRLEGQPRELWEPEIEAARQNYRLLAEQATAAGDQAAAKKNQEDLEAAVRLARMALADLQGLPLPSQ
jgi:tetratricopeptide (TPR) repeat protein